MLLALTTGHKIGLIIAAGVFVAFALSSALLLPRVRPDFPARALPLFLLAAVGLFAAMLTAVVVFGRESKEKAGAETLTTATTQTTTAPSSATQVTVQESEFKITLPSTTLKPGAYVFEAKNTGAIGHDLVINGPGVANAKTPVYDPGKSETLQVTLKPGTYDFYCSVPGHKAAGMDVKVTVS